MQLSLVRFQIFHGHHYLHFSVPPGRPRLRESSPYNRLIPSLSAVTMYAASFETTCMLIVETVNVRGNPVSV